MVAVNKGRITNLHEERVKASKSSRTLTRSSIGRFASIVGQGYDLWILESVERVGQREHNDRRLRLGYKVCPAVFAFRIRHPRNTSSHGIDVNH